MPGPTQSQSYSPTNFFGGEQNNQYPNPFFGVPLQYLPPDIKSQIWWAEHFLVRNGFVRAALERVVCYFLTTLVIEHDDEDLKEKYEEIFEKICWKEILKVSGLNVLAFGNECLTVAQGFERYLECPSCKNAVNIERVNNYKFSKGDFSMKCPTPGCNHTGKFRAHDMPSNDHEKLIVKHWPLRELITRHEQVTGKTDFFWQMPADYIKNISKKDNKFYSKYTPKYIMDAIFEAGGPSLIKLHERNLIHLKMPMPTMMQTNGLNAPMMMFLFEDFFMLQTVKRFNEVICFEDINPFRVFAMASDGNPQNSMVMNQNAGQWKASVGEMIEQHRRDPGSYQSFPFPLNYQNLGGEGKTLAPVELLDKFKGDILDALNIPQELFHMTLQTNAVGPALRLFENAWSSVPEVFDKAVQHIADVISKIYKLEKVKAQLMHVSMADDLEKKSVISQLVAANVIAKSELLETVNLNYKDQLRRKEEERQAEKEIQEEAAQADAIDQENQESVFNQQSGSVPGQAPNPYSTQGATPGDIQEQSQDIAKRLVGQDAGTIRTELQKIKGLNETLYASVKSDMAQIRAQGKSQGVQQVKQQSAQQGS